MIQLRRFLRPAPPPMDVVEGVVDGLQGPLLRGWAWFPQNPDKTAHVQVFLGDRLLSEQDATQFRPDLESAGKRGGHCGFECALPSLPNGPAMLEVRVDGQALGGSPLAVAPQANPAEATRVVDVLPLPISAPRLTGSLDACGPSRVRGWAHWLDDNSLPVALCLMEGEREWLRIEASQWRADLAELRQGDGSCGFDVSLPDALCDGQVHTLTLRLAEDDSPALSTPFRIRTASAHAVTNTRSKASPPPLQRSHDTDTMTLSVIVNFYNMPREAARTLTSLSRTYQQDIDDLDYEVLCIDNGSQPPLDAEWIAGFGPEFRLVRPSKLHASPCAAINEAALQARGRYVAIMIDGAHLLTPGVFREALQAWREQADAVVALRHWFIGGDQRWLALAGYTRAQEDRLFDRIRWPSNGYELFRIGAPIGESPEPWFDGLSESNCLMLPTTLYDRMGGMDTAFDEAGGGFANLDLCRRASLMGSGPMVALVGEASFHQFHGGTTTNVDDAAKDAQVRRYARAYRTLRGEEFTSIHRSQLQYRGRMPSEYATGVRQRALLPMRMEITDQVRPGQLALHFDDGAQGYLQSVYGESALHREVTWRGRRVDVAPADLINLQEIIHEVRPDAIVVVSAATGVLHFLSDAIRHSVCGGTRLLLVAPVDTAPLPDEVTVLQGSPGDTPVLATVRHWVGSAESVLVLYATTVADQFHIDTLRAYADLVSHRSYLICLGTLLGQPWLGYSRHQHMQTVQALVRSQPAFVIDRSRQRQLLTVSPSGYLRRVGGAATAATYDPSLDELPSIAHSASEIPA